MKLKDLETVCHVEYGAFNSYLPIISGGNAQWVFGHETLPFVIKLPRADNPQTNPKITLERYKACINSLGDAAIPTTVQNPDGWDARQKKGSPLIIQKKGTYPLADAYSSIGDTAYLKALRLMDLFIRQQNLTLERGFFPISPALRQSVISDEKLLHVDLDDLVISLDDPSKPGNRAPRSGSTIGVAFVEHGYWHIKNKAEFEKFGGADMGLQYLKSLGIGHLSSIPSVFDPKDIPFCLPQIRKVLESQSPNQGEGFYQNLKSWIDENMSRPAKEKDPRYYPFIEAINHTILRLKYHKAFYDAGAHSWSLKGNPTDLPMEKYASPLPIKIRISPPQNTS